MATTSPPTGLRTGVPPSTKTPSPLKPDNRQAQSDAAEGDGQSDWSWTNPNSGSSAYRTRLGEPIVAPAHKTASPPPWPTDEELRKKYAGVVPEHITRTDPRTGFVIDQWIVHGSDANGKFTTTYRADGPATIVHDPKTGLIIEEDYQGSRGPDGRTYITRDPKTGVTTNERLRTADGGTTYIDRDKTTGIVTYEDRLDKDGKLVACISRDPHTGADLGRKGKNRDGEIVGPPKDPAPADVPKKYAKFAPVVGAASP